MEGHPNKAAATGVDLKRLVRRFRHWQVTFMFAWYDCWVGWFVDRQKCKLYVFPIPMLGVCIDIGPATMIGRCEITATGHCRQSPRVRLKINP